LTNAGLKDAGTTKYECGAVAYSVQYSVG